MVIRPYCINLLRYCIDTRAWENGRRISALQNYVCGYTGIWARGTSTHFWLVEPLPDGLHFPDDGGVGKDSRWSRTDASGRWCDRWYGRRSASFLSNNRGQLLGQWRPVRRHFGRVARAAHGRSLTAAAAVFARARKATRATVSSLRSREHLTHTTRHGHGQRRRRRRRRYCRGFTGNIVTVPGVAAHTTVRSSLLSLSPVGQSIIARTGAVINAGCGQARCG